MPSYDFGVDLQALIDAAKGASEAIADMRDHDVDDFVPRPDALADDELAKAVDDFQNRWDRGINTLVGDIEELAGRLGKVAMTYAAFDADSVDRVATAARSLNPQSAP